MSRTRTARPWATPVILALVMASAGMMECEETPVMLVVTSPVDGDFVPGPTATVTGTINKSPELYTIDVNGVTAVIHPDRTWSVEIPLDEDAIFNDIVASATNAVFSDVVRLRVIAGSSVADGDFSTEGVALRINDTGLDALEPVVGSLIDLDLGTLLPVGTEIIDDCFIEDPLFGLCLGSAVVRVANPPPTSDGFSTAFDAQTGQVVADIDLLGLAINVDIDGSGLVPNCGLLITATETTIGGFYDLEPMASDPSAVDVSQIGNASVAFAGFDDDFGGICDAPIIGDIIQLFLPDIQSTTENGVRDFLNTLDANGNTPVAGAVEDALAGVDISGPIGASLGADLDAPFFQIVEDESGLTLGSDVRFVATCTPPAGAPDFEASYSLTDPFPTFGPNTPGGLPYGIGICISTSGMNQLLRAQTECGLLLTSISELELFGSTNPLTTSVLATFIPAFGTFPPATPVRIDLVPKLAPVFSGNVGPGGELGELKIASLSAKVVQDDGSETVFLQFDIDANVGVNLSVDAAANVLAFELEQPPGSAISVNIVSSAIEADPAQLEAILPSILAFFFPSLADALASFPVPTFLDLQLDVVEIDRNGEFFSIFADLSPPPSP
ncbi:MAG: hypothetical protein AAF436_17375 [Myxococcota bacterium]